MMRLRPLLFGFAMTLCFGAFTDAAGSVSSDRLELQDLGPDTVPGIEWISSTPEACFVEFSLPYLNRERVIADGSEYQSLTIPGGALTGRTGAPAVPTYGGLLEVPAGRSVRIVVHQRESQHLKNTLLFPVQPDDGREFVRAEDYEQGGKSSPAIVTLGEPAILHGHRVVPFVIHPVSCDPAARTVEIQTRLEIEFVFDGQDDRNNPRRRAQELPASFNRLLAREAVNALPGDGVKSLGDGELGTYLVICPNQSAVVSALQPLLDWRRRQGYSVQLATTAETGSTTTSIKSYLQNFYDTAAVPLEFVVLVGDHNGDIAIPTYFESLSGYGGEGDHYYSQLEGDDVLADVFLGRLSCRDTSELTTIVDKIVNYETAPPTGDPSWYTRASLTADPSASGTSTIYVSQWMKAQLEAHSFTQVDTFWSGNFSAQMLSSLNQGLSIFTYRGYLGMSGFHSGHINSATNGGMLPFAIFPTCDSGSWASETDARNEAFLRAPGGGAIGAIGLATIGTHTRYNNVLFHGICESAINGDDHRLGIAQAAGKLEIYKNYEPFEADRVEIWSVWSSLIGDPATDLRISPPLSLTVEHPATLPVGGGTLPVQVTEGGLPVAGAVVALYKDGEISLHATTDSSGRAVFALPGHTAGSVLVTVWGQGLMPYLGATVLGTVDVHLDLAQTMVDDDATGGSQGNADSTVNPDETLELSCELVNRGTQLAGAVMATLTSSDPYVTILEGSDTFGDLAGGASAWGSDGFLIRVSATAPADHVLEMVLTAASGADEWISALQLPVKASALTATQTAWSLGGNPQPGQSGSLTVTLGNLGGATASDASGILTCESPWVTITDGAADFGTIDPAGTADNSADPFAVQIAADCFQGHLAVFSLEITESSGAVRVVEFTVPVGTVTVSDPVGPDAYGYYAFDNTDSAYLLAPTYDWVEIDPHHGGAGTSVGLNDFGYEQDDTQVLDLPFTFTYYGQDFSQIAVCSNGWIAMGNTTLVHWRNWSIPSAGSPNTLIAPFWDDLNQSGENQVYSWYDATHHRLVVQWSRMTNRTGGTQNFEVILHDPLAYPTTTGDGEILFQYETVNNNDTSRGYATTGIQNLDGTDGVLVTYYNQYAPAAAELSAGRAILFRPAGPDLDVTCDAAPTALAVTLATDEQSTEQVRVANHGEAGSVLRYQITKVDPAPPTAAPPVDKNLTYSDLTADISQYEPGQTIDLLLTVSCVSDDLEWIVGIEADFPPGVSVNSATSFAASNSLDYVGSTGDGALAQWANGHVGDNTTGEATVNVTFGAVGGPIEIPYTLTGDNWGSAPHQISGTLVLEQAGPSIFVVSPNGGESWAEGETRDIQYSATGGPTTVAIELDRGDGTGWQLLAADVPAGNGSYVWNVTGPISAQCRIRVVDSDDPGLFDISDEMFMIGRNLSWVTVGTYSGVVLAGEGEDIVLDFDSTGLAEGSYRADLLIANNAGAIVTVPITLTVAGPTPVDTPAPALQLGRNYPNPFNPRTSIQFSLPEAMDIDLSVFDLRGHLIKILHRGAMPAGNHTLVWDGTDAGGRSVSSGMFLCRMVAGDRVLKQKMLLMK